MTAGSEPRRAIVGAMLGFLYGSILTFVSIFAAGAGHGTSIPLLLSSAPLAVFGLVESPWRISGYYVGDHALLLSAPLVWAMLGSLVALSGRGKLLRLTQVLVLLQYASGLALAATTGGDLDILARDAWVRIYVVVWTTVYLVGQVALWWRIMRRNRLD
jgi:hypothetical protein